MILIKKCCVCGAEYGDVKSADLTTEDYEFSHGFCGKACMDYKTVTILYRKHDKNTNKYYIDTDRGFFVGNTLYFHTELVSAYITINVNNVVETHLYNNETGGYNHWCDEGEAKDTFKHAEETAKDWAKLTGLVILCPSKKECMAA